MGPFPFPPIHPYLEEYHCHSGPRTHIHTLPVIFIHMRASFYFSSYTLFIGDFFAVFLMRL